MCILIFPSKIWAKVCIRHNKIQYFKDFFIYFYILLFIFITFPLSVRFRYSDKLNSPHMVSRKKMGRQGSDIHQQSSHAPEGISYFWPRFSYIFAIGLLFLLTHCEFICSPLSSISLSVLSVLQSWYIDSIP